jgi:hypothetical protein
MRSGEEVIDYAMGPIKWLKNVEPPLDDILSDPIVLLVIGTRNSPEGVRLLLEAVARSRRPATPLSTAPLSYPKGAKSIS